MAGALALVAAVIGLLILLQPVLQPLGNLNLLIFFVGLVGALVFAAVPIAFCFGLATFGYIALTTTTPEVVVIGRMDEGMSHLILLSVPLFVFLGLLIEMTGMARAMVAFLASLLGHVRGGLPVCGLLVQPFDRLGDQPADVAQRVQALGRGTQGLGGEEVHGADHGAVDGDREAHPGLHPDLLRDGCPDAVGHLADVLGEEQVAAGPGPPGQADSLLERRRQGDRQRVGRRVRQPGQEHDGR